jgi:long-chain fatty acid transport protein
MCESSTITRMCCTVGALLAGLLATGPLAMGQGVALRGVSPVNTSMAGAATACPIDSAGALHWNPASISGLPCSDISFGMELILPTTTLSSRFDALHLAGSDQGEPGVTPVPSMAFVRKCEDSPWSYGLGMFGIGGSSVNYPASLTNPILTPQPPNGIGLGRLSANVDIYQIVPTVSYQVNERLSIGFAPTITMGRLLATPLFLGPKNDANGDGYATWSPGVGTRYVWGGGFQLGAYYTTDTCWNFGASVSSPQWIEPFRYKSEDERGRPTDITFNMNYPLIASIGTSYTGIENWILACDLRFFDYADTTGFRNAGFSPAGALQGLAWNNIFSVAIGVQRRLNDRWSIRGGYCFNENPIDSDAEQFNVASPLIIQHALHLGASCMFADNFSVAIAYTHGFENSVTGPLHSAMGPIPGTSVTSTASADAISLGATKRF